MIKEIKYSGYAAVPSDYDCPDGQLAYSLNLLQEGEGALHSIPDPACIRSFSEVLGSTGFDKSATKIPFFLHKPTGASNLIDREYKAALGCT